MSSSSSSLTTSSSSSSSVRFIVLIVGVLAIVGIFLLLSSSLSPPPTPATHGSSFVIAPAEKGGNLKSETTAGGKYQSNGFPATEASAAAAAAAAGAGVAVPGGEADAPLEFALPPQHDAARAAAGNLSRALRNRTTCIAPNSRTAYDKWPFHDSLNPTNRAVTKKQLDEWGTWPAISSWWAAWRSTAANANSSADALVWSFCSATEKQCSTPSTEFTIVSSQQQQQQQQQQQKSKQRSFEHITSRLTTVPRLPASKATIRLVEQWLRSGILVFDFSAMTHYASDLSRVLPGFFIEQEQGKASTSDTVHRMKKHHVLALSNLLMGLGILDFSVGSSSPWVKSSQQPSNNNSSRRSIISVITSEQLKRQNKYLPCQPGSEKRKETHKQQAEKFNGTRAPEIAGCIITKNRARALVEWIQHHRILGVSVFFVYDDGSTDNTFEALQPFVDAGIVKYVTGPLRKGKQRYYSKQQQFYGQCLSMTMGLARGMRVQYYGSYLDNDEFISVQRGCVQDRLFRWIRENPGAPELAMTVRYVPSDARSNFVNSHAKTIAEQTKFSPGRILFPTVKPLFSPWTIWRVKDAHSNWHTTSVRVPAKKPRLSDGSMILHQHAQYDAPMSSAVHRDLVVLHYFQGPLSQFILRKMTGRADVGSVKYVLDVGSALEEWRTMSLLAGSPFDGAGAFLTPFCDERGNPTNEPPDGVWSMKEISNNFKARDRCLRCMLFMEADAPNCEALCGQEF